ncbi:hypothetical protein AVEN_152112-1 [Araneus ventricosus]|uniref:Uncharacterized protein n=1 Tax=Araneus ventricosus TaxID=182803 RepID=A0A4Y2IYE9_ARAVE|nr:hypothetical protein AVEN_152112-1 [Araneus ventricosus]
MLSIGAKIADMGSSKISQECWDVWLVERNCVLESIVRWMLSQRKFKQWSRWSTENGVRFAHLEFHPLLYIKALSSAVIIIIHRSNALHPLLQH